MTDGTHMSEVYCDAGVVWQAAKALVTLSTLDDHVLIDETNRVIRLDPDDVPIYLWGDATQGLWALLVKITHGDLRTLVGRCDPENKAAVAAAIVTLCGAS